MSATRRLRVAYLGPAGSFSHAAARRRYGARGVRYIACADIPLVVESALAGRVDRAVVPVENTSGGMIGDALDRLMHGGLRARGLAIVEELRLDIHLALLAQGSGPVRRICSHPVPLYHCRAWIHERYPDAAIEGVASTSQAVALAARRREVAAIGTVEAGRRAGLNVLCFPILPERPNQTAFFVVGRSPRAPRRNGKTGLAVTLRHRPGALYHALGVLAKRRLNLTRIESRPLPDRPGEYVFFIEFEGAAGGAEARGALRELSRRAQSVQVLGAYAVRRFS